jgi:xanthine dehydrogenase molybdenum-binding subunit
MRELQAVAKTAPRLDAAAIVTGAAHYVGDLRFPGMLEGALLYAGHASARIRHIRASRARDMAGVAAVLTHADLSGPNSYSYGGNEDQPLLASDAVRYQGDIVAAAAAVDEITARRALQSIDVRYELVSGVFDPAAALEPGSPQVWPDRPNLHQHLVIARGDAKAAIAAADVVIERTYTTQRIEHAYLEPEGAVAVPEQDGTMTVYSSTQAPHSDRMQIARALGVPDHEIRVVTPHIGGAFGGKQEAHVQIHAALLARRTGRPVRIVRSREESIRTHVKRHPITVHYTTGATAEGDLVAIVVEAVGDTGPYVNAGADVMSVLAQTVSGPYRVPHARIEAFTVHTNNPIGGAMRGFGIPQGAYACEQQMDLVADAVGIDPLELRLRNIVATGDHLPSGAVIREGRPLRVCLEEAAERSQWSERVSMERRPEPHLRRGWGVATGFKAGGMGRGIPDSAGVEIEMTGDASVVVRTGAAEVGQGVHTALAQIAAEELGVELAQVRVVTPDTDVTPDAGPTCASRVTFVSGNAVRDATAVVCGSLLEAAATLTGRPVTGLSLGAGYVQAEGEQLITIAEAAATAKEANLPLLAQGFYAMEYPEELPDDGYPYASMVFSYGAQVAQVLVDIETGEVTVEALTVVHDAGRVVNPDGALGQMEGGAAMGLGYALFEDLCTKEGIILNDSLESYLVPTSGDIPEMNIGLVEIDEPMAPFGAKGIGESSIAPVPGAVANAIADATGVRIGDLPLTPERVLAALQEAG